MSVFRDTVIVDENQGQTRISGLDGKTAVGDPTLQTAACVGNLPCTSNGQSTEYFGMKVNSSF